MQTRTVEQVESWDSRPFSGDVRELHELADEDFSGTVVADDTWVFFLNGRVIGVFQGEIDDVIDVDGTVYSAPDSSLPLLFSMQERGGEPRAKYFTNDTSVESVDETLREANFTGYLELSENVLSGDYYISYYGGKSLSTAFVGQSERLITGDEAFEKANDEVGVFEVRDISFGITELPQIDEAETESDESAAATTSQTTEGTAAAAASVDESPSEETEEATQEPAQDTETEADAADPSEQPEPDDARTETETEAEADAETKPSQSADDPSVTEEPPAEEGPATDPTATQSEPPSDHERRVREWGQKDSSRRESAGENDLFREEAEWRKTTSIPALDPDESEPDAASADDTRQRTSTARGQSSTPRRDNAPPSSSGRTGGSRERGTSSTAANREDSPPSGRTDPAEPRRDAGSETTPDDRPDPGPSGEPQDSRIESLEDELSSIESKRDELEETVSELREERSTLENRVESLESKLETAERDSSSGGLPNRRDMSASDAIGGTNVFVRYDSKGKPTLDALDETSVDPEEVNENLRLDHHTTFEASEATVDGRPYEEFLHETSRFRFVEWLVRELPYELLNSGARNDLGEIYDAIPAIDRIEFDGTIDVESTGEGQSSHQFDVVVRDRMGDPLVVADSNNSRDPVDHDSMDDLVSGATTVGAANESLAGAFYVTTSYFDPDALERAQDAASDGGFFSRSGKESFVKVARKRGYHLCLVEDRQDSFHVTVPEL